MLSCQHSLQALQTMVSQTHMSHKWMDALCKTPDQNKHLAVQSTNQEMNSNSICSEQHTNYFSIQYTIYSSVQIWQKQYSCRCKKKMQMLKTTADTNSVLSITLKMKSQIEHMQIQYSIQHLLLYTAHFYKCSSSLFRYSVHTIHLHTVHSMHIIFYSNNTCRI